MEAFSAVLFMIINIDAKVEKKKKTIIQLKTPFCDFKNKNKLKQTLEEVENKVQQCIQKHWKYSTLRCSPEKKKNHINNSLNSRRSFRLTHLFLKCFPTKVKYYYYAFWNGFWVFKKKKKITTIFHTSLITFHREINIKCV